MSRKNTRRGGNSKILRSLESTLNTDDASDLLNSHTRQLRNSSASFENNIEPNIDIGSPVQQLHDYSSGTDEEWNDISDKEEHQIPDFLDENQFSEDAQKVRDLFSSDDDDNDEDYYNDQGESFVQEDHDAYEANMRRKKKAVSASKAMMIQDEAKMYYTMAISEYESNNHADAIALLEEAIARDPESKLPYMLLDAIYFDLGDVDKSLRAKVAAALLDKNKDDWIDVARISVELGKLDQAAIFYKRAIDIDDTDTQLMFELVTLYISIDKMGNATNLMKRIHELDPANATYSNQLAQIYMNRGMIQDAVNLFEHILKLNRELTYIDPQLVQPFGWSELNALAELYNKQRAWQKCIKTVKSVSRWLLDRVTETWWDERKDDAEFDNRRLELMKKPEYKKGLHDEEKFVLPLDIRCKLLLARLKIGDIKEAHYQNEYLLQADPESYLDLFWEVGQAYIECNEYETALEILVKLLELNETTSELLLAIGKCEYGIKNYEEAEGYYKLVLDTDPKNVEGLVGLAETYMAMNRDDEAKELITKVRDIRVKLSEYVEANKESRIKSGLKSDGSSTKSNERKNASTTRLPSAEELESNFKNLKRYWDQIIENRENMVAITEWTQIANNMINMFLSVKRFNKKNRGQILGKEESSDINARLDNIESSIQQNDIGKFQYWYILYMC